MSIGQIYNHSPSPASLTFLITNPPPIVPPPTALPSSLFSLSPSRVQYPDHAADNSQDCQSLFQKNKASEGTPENPKGNRLPISPLSTPPSPLSTAPTPKKPTTSEKPEISEEDLKHRVDQRLKQILLGIVTPEFLRFSLWYSLLDQEKTTNMKNPDISNQDKEDSVFETLIKSQQTESDLPHEEPPLNFRSFLDATYAKTPYSAARNINIPKREWDKIVSNWRRLLHIFDKIPYPSSEALLTSLWKNHFAPQRKKAYSDLLDLGIDVSSYTVDFTQDSIAKGGAISKPILPPVGAEMSQTKEEKFVWFPERNFTLLNT
jgi:hypothetical protein